MEARLGGSGSARRSSPRLWATSGGRAPRGGRGATAESSRLQSLRRSMPSGSWRSTPPLPRLHLFKASGEPLTTGVTVLADAGWDADAWEHAVGRGSRPVLGVAQARAHAARGAGRCGAALGQRRDGARQHALEGSAADRCRLAAAALPRRGQAQPAHQPEGASKLFRCSEILCPNLPISFFRSDVRTTGREAIEV